VVTATEIEMEATAAAADHARKIHERDSTKATATKRILVRSEGTRSTGHYLVCLVVGFSSVFLPFINRGKRFLDAISTKGSIASSRPSLPSPNTKAFQFSSW
jgi:hypothetical protein